LAEYQTLGNIRYSDITSLLKPSINFFNNNSFIYESKLTYIEAQGPIYLQQSSRRRNDDYHVGLTS